METRSPILVAARKRLQASRDRLAVLVDAAEKRGDKGFNTVEGAEADDLIRAIREDQQIVADLEIDESRMSAASASWVPPTGRKGVFHISGGETYSQGGTESFFRDMAVLSAATTGWQGDIHPEEASARLNQHRREIDVEARANPDLANRLQEIRQTPQTLREQRVNPNTTAGTGGEFVPPLWAIPLYAPYARPGRVIADRIPSHPLPPGIDQINIPKIKLGSLTAVQSAQAQPVASQDITTSTVSAPVITIAGQEDVSMQLIEQSPLSMDGVIYADLMSDYDQRLDLQVIAGTGTNGQHLGALSQTAASANSTTTLNTDITKMNAVTCASATFFDGTTTSFSQYRSIVNGVTNIETLRFRSPTAIWAHPRRIASWSYAADTANRPQFVKYGPYNAVGQQMDAIAQGVAGEIYSIPVVKDANMPTTCSTGSITSGAGDCIGIVNEEDMLLYEGTVRLRALVEVLSGTLQVRYQLYCYSAYFPHRFPASSTLITGSAGLAAAAF